MRHLVSGAYRLPSVLLTLLLLLSIACGTTRALRDAQDAFNDAAKADMQLRTAPEETTAALLGVRNGGYRTTVGIIDAFNTIERNKLSGDNLWGNALMLKAMSEWRLGEYDNAMATKEEASQFASQLGTRDTAVLNVLGGLIALDQANDKLGREVDGKLPCEYQTVNSLVTSGLTMIEAERASLSAGEPVQRYLLQAKLAGHRTRQLAEDCKDGGQPPSDDEIAAKKKDWCALQGSGTQAKVVEDWHGLLGLGEDPCK